jgi:hypothetical protein
MAIKIKKRLSFFSKDRSRFRSQERLGEERGKGFAESVRKWLGRNDESFDIIETTGGYDCIIISQR